MSGARLSEIEDQTLGKAARILSSVLAVCLTFAAVGWAADLPLRFGLAPYSEQFLALILALSLGIVFLSRPARWRVLDWLLAAIGAGAGLFVMVDYPNLIAQQMALPAHALVLGGVLLLLSLEGLRRCTGWPLVLVVLGIIGVGLIGHLIPGALRTREVAPERLLMYVSYDPGGLFGKVLMVAGSVVIAFVFFGQLLLKSGGADFFNDIAIALMGRRRGGSAKVAVVASSLFGSISGVVVSNIVATGVVTIRMMIHAGYKRHQAAAIEAVASTGGQIVPPVMGAVAFLMADILQTSYQQIVIAAIVPALLYYIAIFAQADLQAGKDDIALVDVEKIPPAGQVLRRGWVFFLPFAAITFALFVYGQRPETAALWGGALALAVGVVTGYGKRIHPTQIWAACVQTGHSVVDIIMIAAAAGFMIGVLNITGLGFGLTFVLVNLGGDSLLLLLLIAAVVCLILGMGMPTVGVYLLLAVLIAPSLVQSGVEPTAAHLFIFYLGMMSMVTPPVAIGAFFAASIAGTSPMKTALVAMRFGWTAYVIPFLFVFSPTLLLKGPLGLIILDVAGAALGVYIVSAAAVGWFGRHLGVLERFALGLCGLLIMAPAAAGGHLALKAVALGLTYVLHRYDVASRFRKPDGTA